MRRTSTLLAVAALLSAAAPAAARVPEGAQRLGDPSSNFVSSFDPALATAPGGRSIALVADGGSMTVRRATPGGAFGPPRQLDTSADLPAVATGEGLTALAWTHLDASAVDMFGEPCCRRLHAATLDASGRASTPRELSAPGYDVTDLRVVVRGRRAAVAWIDARGVRASVAATDGAGFGPARSLGPVAGDLLGVALPASGPHVFLLDGASVVEAWRTGGRPRRRILGRLAIDPFPVAAAVTPAGHLLLAGTPRSGSDAGHRVLVGYRGPGERLRHSVAHVRRRLSRFAVALAPTGRGLLAVDAERNAMTLRAVGRGARLGRPRAVRRLAARNGYATDIALAVDRGAGVLAVHVEMHRGWNVYAQVVAWPLTAGGVPGRRRVVSPVVATAGNRSGIVATIDAARRRRVAWEQGSAIYAMRLR